MDLAERAVAEARVDALAELGGLEGRGALAALPGLVQRVGEQLRAKPLPAMSRQRGDHRDERVVADVLDQYAAGDRAVHARRVGTGDAWREVGERVLQMRLRVAVGGVVDGADVAQWRALG